MKMVKKITGLSLLVLFLAGCLWEPVSEGTAASPVALAQYDVHEGSVGRNSSSYYVVDTLFVLNGLYLENTQGNPLDVELSFFLNISDIDSRDPTIPVLVLSTKIFNYFDYNFPIALPDPFYLRIDSKAPVVGQKYVISVY